VKEPEEPALRTLELARYPSHTFLLLSELEEVGTSVTHCNRWLLS
jgi:hypothetical protein